MPRIESKPKTTIYQGQEVVTIDCEPTWEYAMRTYILVLENGTEEGRKAARADLMDLAKAVDKMKAKAKTTANIEWTVRDIHEHNQENEDYPMTDEDAMEILQAAIADHDHDFGVNWLHIDNEIAEWKARQDAIERRAKDEGLN